MKTCSFLPAATNIIYEIGLEEMLHGVTFECESQRPKVVRSYLEVANCTSLEIDKFVRRSKQRGESFYYVDEELLHSISPDVIFTQDVCDVCELDTGTLRRAIAQLQKRPKLVSLTPRTVADIYDNVLSISIALNSKENGDRLLQKLHNRVGAVSNMLLTHQASSRSVMLLEWLDPLFNCGHWTPNQIGKAGGSDLLSNPGGYSATIDWNDILNYDPEVLIISPCGFQIEKTMKEVGVLKEKPRWKDLRAVRNSAVFAVDADLFTQPSTKVVDGIEVLAALFHPAIFSIPERLRNKVISLCNDL